MLCAGNLFDCPLIVWRGIALSQHWIKSIDKNVTHKEIELIRILYTQMEISNLLRRSNWMQCDQLPLKMQQNDFHALDSHFT